MSRKTFVLSSGRSGTLWLSNLLDNLNKVDAYHEPGERQDRNSFTDAYKSNDKARRYIHRERDWTPAQKCREKYYIEVNSYLRYHAEVLQADSSAKVIHLVRNPCDVIRSHLPRTNYTDEDDVKITPKPDDPFYTAWEYFGRFEKICWNWWHANKYLYDNVETSVNLEALNENPRSLISKILPHKPNNLHDVWSNFANNSMHETSNNAYPEPENWDRSKKKSFKQICGNIAKELGYDYPKPKRWERGVGWAN